MKKFVERKSQEVYIWNLIVCSQWYDKCICKYTVTGHWWGTMNRWLQLSPGMSVILCMCWTNMSVLGQCLLWMNPPWKWYLLAAGTVLELFRGSSIYLRPDIYLTGFQVSVRLFALYCLSVIVSRGQRCVWKTCWYMLFSHACLSVS